MAVKRRSVFQVPFLAMVSLGLLAVTFALCRLRPLYWADVWWQLGSGRYILKHHHIPLTDVFSWTALGLPWINTEWLYQVLLYTLVSHWGLSAVLLVKTLLCIVAMYFMDCRLRFWKAAPLERIIFLGTAYLGAWPFWVERADLVSLALLSALFYSLDRGDFSDASPTRRGLWMLLFMAWANLHGAFPLGIGVIGLCGVLQWPRHRLAGRRILGGSLLCAAATLINPYGWGLWTGILRNMSGDLTHVYEWTSPSGWGFLFFFLAVGFTGTVFALRRTWERHDLYAALIALIFVGYALKHQRFVHFFMLGAFPYAAREWLLGPWRARLIRRTARIEKLVLLISCFVFFATSLVSARRMRGGVDAVAAGYVEEVCDFIQTQKIQGPFFNDYFFGSYWIWRFGGTPPVYQDSRHASVIGYDTIIARTQAAQNHPVEWAAWVETKGIQAALVRYPAVRSPGADTAFDRYFPRSSWALVYWDDQCLLFVRRAPQNPEFLRKWEYRVLKPEWSLNVFKEQLRHKRVNRAAARLELERNLDLNPHCRQARAGLYWLNQL